MKFKKHLDQNLVPEWRIKYIDYKTGKKKLKTITRLQENASPNNGDRNDESDSLLGDRKSSSVPLDQPARRSTFQRLIYGKEKESDHAFQPSSAAYNVLADEAERNFFDFLDKEVEKITKFYDERENSAKDRFMMLEHQTEIMIQNRQWIKSGQKIERVTSNLPTVSLLTGSTADITSAPVTRESVLGLDPGRRDYVRKPAPYVDQQKVPFKVAKRKIKLAMLEYYKGLELIKSYCALNREGFRKILKKFDKVAGKREASKFMRQKIYPASFCNSDEIDILMGKVENLYAQHWTDGKRKIAVTRLRTRDDKKAATDAMFRVGVYLGFAIPFIVESVLEAFKERKDSSIMFHKSEASFLLQVWAGIGLPIFFMLLFALCCRAWMRNKINYVFIFEFDTKHNLDWRQLMEIPAFLFALLGFFMLISFSDFWETSFDRIWFPVVYLSLVFIIMFNPFKFVYYYSRRWFAIAHWRLLLAGVFAVEFRDFWLGDMLCSLTYSMATIPLLGCLYVHNWDEAEKCNSSNFWVQGLFTAIPPIWRLAQCIRRFADSGHKFPHLANAIKYLCAVVTAGMLTMWRLDVDNNLWKNLFIAFASINSIYGTVWDIAMDWSLLDWDAPNRLLRVEMGFKRPLVYYLAIIVDPPLRCTWIFLIIFRNNMQHSAALAFTIAFAEVLRRWIWCFFRLENEHCNNVGRFRASRDDVPLPYKVELPEKKPRVSQDSLISERSPTEESTTTALPPKRDFRGRVNSKKFVVRKLSDLATMASKAHAQDFERRRAPSRRRGRRADSDDERDAIVEEDEEEEYRPAAHHDATYKGARPSGDNLV